MYGKKGRTWISRGAARVALVGERKKGRRRARSPAIPTTHPRAATIEVGWGDDRDDHEAQYTGGGEGQESLDSRKKKGMRWQGRKASSRNRPEGTFLVRTSGGR